MKIIMIAIIILIILLLGIKYWHSARQAAQNEHIAWKQKYPKLFNNVGYDKLAASQTKRSTTIKSKELRNLLGKSTNPFGIRDDILEYIVSNIPESNLQARVAGIKMAQFFQSEIGETDPDKINQDANKASAAIYCLKLSSLQEEGDFIHNYAALMRNTPDRMAEQNRIQDALNGRVVSPDFGNDSTNNNSQQQCNNFLGLQND